ncbi:transmembrane protein 267 [Cephus cinctus]|uniref:Transmembrane protein 267 n=1 Tax=Cephus cinctus TaxID=211228 RepID=A0AAJ7BH03_CEPCN|nr:transmembrane protein 267 [Cephus cinctus]
MFYTKRETILCIFVTSMIALCSHLGDRMLKHGSTPAMRAIFDNLTHATVGALTWSLIIILSRKSVVHNVFQIVSCFLVSSLIDLDHFLSARSWRLSDATRLDKRPFLHCSTVPIFAWLVLIAISKMTSRPNLINHAWILLAAFFSHHIRDASRKGMWFYPFGSTPPIPYYFYIFISMTLPFVIHWLMFTPMPLVEYDAMSIDIV